MWVTIRMDDGHTDKRTAPSVCDGRHRQSAQSRLCIGALGPWARLQHLGRAILSSAQLKPHLMRWLCCLLPRWWEGDTLGAWSVTGRLVNWRREHYLWLYPDGNLVCPGGSLRRHIRLQNPLCLQGTHCKAALLISLRLWADGQTRWWGEPSLLSVFQCTGGRVEGVGGQAAGKCLPTSPINVQHCAGFCQQTGPCCLCFWLVGIFCPAASAIVLN